MNAALASERERRMRAEAALAANKLLMAAIVILFLVVLYRYLKQERDGFLLALKQRLPWAFFTRGWSGVFVLSQLVDQIPFFHNAIGQIFEEVFESCAEVFVLIAAVLFRIQVRGDTRAGRLR